MRPRCASLRTLCASRHRGRPRLRVPLPKCVRAPELNRNHRTARDERASNAGGCRCGGACYHGAFMSEPEEPDASLVARMALGDASSLATLYDRHAARLLGLAVRLLGNRVEAQDLLHDVFLEAWRKANDYRGALRALVAADARAALTALWRSLNSLNTIRPPAR
jgi:hypothetical protein